MTKTIRVVRRGERGAILPLFVLLLTAMLAFTGLGVDLGWWYARSMQIQRAADAAALAAVVWMPDTVAAQKAAQDSLKSNKFVAGGDIAITYEPIQPQRYRVTVKDAKVEAYFTRVFMGDITVQKKALSEYQLAVPMGSPFNHVGTPTDDIYAAVNGFCTAKEYGDELLSRFDGTAAPLPHRCPATGGWVPPGPATGPNGAAESNPSYETPTTSAPFVGGYSYYVDVPAGHAAINVALFDAAYFNTDPTNLSPDQVIQTGSTITTTYRLRAPDPTPLDDSDNPLYLACNRSFVTNDAAALGTTIAGSSRYTSLCTIPVGATAGKYILDVYTKASEAASIGINSYGIFLKETGRTPETCDQRVTASCPRVYGAGQLSVYQPDAGASATFYLAQISPTYAGKQMVIKLWDPGEGGSTIELLDPNNNPVSFTYTTEDGLYTGASGTSLNVSGTGPQPSPAGNRSLTSKFNDRKVLLTTLLPASTDAKWTSLQWGASTKAYWWKIRYTFALGTVNDRTTWTVNVFGQPVHLLSEQ